MATEPKWLHDAISSYNKGWIGETEFAYGFLGVCDDLNYPELDIVQFFGSVPEDLQMELLVVLKNLEAVEYRWRPWGSGEGFTDEELEKLRVKTAAVHRILNTPPSD